MAEKGRSPRWVSLPSFQTAGDAQGHQVQGKTRAEYL